MTLAGSLSHFSLGIAEILRRMRRRIVGAGNIGMRIAGPAPERLLIVPPDLQAGDATIAQEIYSGVFQFAGKHFSTGGGNPFRIETHEEIWLRELNSFGWLRHLAAAKGLLMAKNAQALLRDWLELNSRPRHTIAWEPEIAARRLIAWCCHSILILENADIRFYRLFMKSIGAHIRYLRGVAPIAPEGLPKLLVQIALSYASVCVSGARYRLAQRGLDAELANQILPDGGHISRNASCLPEVAALLLPLRQSFAKLGQAPSRELISAIDRIMPAIRFYRMGDGNFCRMNGVSATQRNLVFSVLRFDDSSGQAPDQAEHSGYQRLAQGETVILLDTGRPPEGELSAAAHAGCLSFEMSCVSAPVIVNCGAPTIPNPLSAIACRSTAAHSTATLNDTSSCRFGGGGIFGDLLKGRVVAGPARVAIRRENDEAGAIVSASHDGYLRSFGLVHHRSIRLSGNGNRIDGLDRFLAANGKPRRKAKLDKAAIRFHLHPSVSAGRAGNSGKIVLSASGGVRWIFECAAVAPVVEESVFFASSSGPRRCSQIVLHFRTSEIPEISWALLRAV